jgi:hypothetical protein
MKQSPPIFQSKAWDGASLCGSSQIKTELLPNKISPYQFSNLHLLARTKMSHLKPVVSGCFCVMQKQYASTCKNNMRQHTMVPQQSAE